MREIKFRGKRLDNGEWIFGSWYGYENPQNQPISLILPFDDNWWDVFGVRVDPATVGQYTGIKDKNCVEIYEGDIVICNNIKSVVSWDEKELRYFLNYINTPNICWLGNWFNGEVIGNVSDNPELLKS